jgi:predicted unusual protein kinase regulating ubiquinone biosynthesis (AarF/ABC1/UbiB family)
MDNFSTLKKIKRYFDTSKVAAGFAARLAGEKYFDVDINNDAYAELLKQSLGELKGPLMKAAQFLTTIPDTLPAEYYALLELQAQAPSMGVPFVKRRLKTELGENWHDHFEQFDYHARSAASLGQVHKAILKNGSTVAVKLQYPNMMGVTETDLEQLKFLFYLYEKLNKAINTDDIFEELASRLYEELDYTLEAKNLDEFNIFFKNDDIIKVPQVYTSLSTNRLLTMEWIEGESILNFENADEDLKNHLGKNLFLSWYKPLYHNGMLHGDPHPGNYLVLKDQDKYKIALLDFGCVRRFEAVVLEGIKNLFYGLLKNDRNLSVHAFEQLGFLNLDNDIIDSMLSWANLLYDPLLENVVRPIQNKITTQQSFKLAQKIHEELKKKGGIRPPRSFVFLDRAAVGIGSVLMRLQSKQNWHQLFVDILDQS